MLSLGYAFVNTPGDEGTVPAHLWFVISNPTPDEKVVMVNLTTWTGSFDSDPSCVLDVGDHPFVKHKSYINYHDRAVQYRSIHSLEEMLAEGTCYERPSASGDLLKRIIEGAGKSPHFPNEYRDILRDQGLIHDNGLANDHEPNPE